MFTNLFTIFLLCSVSEVVTVEVTSITTSKITSDGLPFGGPIIQRLTKGFKYIDGFFWQQDCNALVFIGRDQYLFNMYYPESGKTYTFAIEELVGQQISSATPILDRKNQYIVAVNRSIYLLNTHGEKLKMNYTIKEIMTDITDFDLIFAKTRTDGKHNLIIGTKLTEYPEGYKENQTKFFRLDIEKNGTTLIDNKFDQTAGICFDEPNKKLYLADNRKNLIYEYDYDAISGKTSNKTIIFNMADYNTTVHGKVTAIVMDTNKKLWIGLVESSMLIVYDTVLKEISSIIGVPTFFVSALGWGGKKYDILFVGTSRDHVGFDPLINLYSGNIYGITGTGSKGWKSSRIRVPDSIA